MPTRGTIKRIKDRAKQEQDRREEVAGANTSASQEPSAPSEPQSLSSYNEISNLSKLQFPIKDKDLYKGKVRFRVVQLEALTTAQLGNLEFVDEILNSDTLSKLDEKIDKDNNSQSTEEKQKRNEIANKDLQILKGSNNQSYDNPRAQKKYGGSVSLYLPQSLQISDVVSYSNGTPLGTIGAGVEGGLAGGASALNAVGAGLTQGISSFTELFSGGSLDKDAGALALTRAAETFGTAEIGAGVKAATRVAINPNLRTLLENVPIREIPFNFRLVARNRRESEEIERIIKFFRYQLYPDEITGQIGGATVSLGYKFPDPFEISATYGGKQVGTKFLDAYLRQVSVTYNEQSMGFHADGYPTDVTMSLSFIESKALTRKLVEEGY